MIRRPPRSTQSRSSAASDVYKRQVVAVGLVMPESQLGTVLSVLAQLQGHNATFARLGPPPRCAPLSPLAFPSWGSSTSTLGAPTFESSAICTVDHKALVWGGSEATGLVLTPSNRTAL
eukprot:TRINITY_DN18247_c0_g1_i1.p1 TRINITY_DN18247_c0_g1~~TRINITY_DN18247_c0_g1_i1.p1  ORF type:complete len:119 (+),score=11.60 TRINITY_DN18247_c0_g1_i1:111-467(+)